MATITIQLKNICPGGGHATLSVTGDVTRDVVVDIQSTLDDVATMEPDEVLDAVLRLAKMGKTNSQLKTALQAGITVNV